MNYAYKGNVYKKDKIAEMKNPATGKWEKCMIYVSVDSGETYVRNLDDFNRKFVKQ